MRTPGSICVALFVSRIRSSAASGRRHQTGRHPGAVCPLQLTAEQTTAALLELTTSNQSEKQGGWLLQLELPSSCRVRRWDLKPGRAAWAVARYGARTLYLGAGLEGCRIKGGVSQTARRRPVCSMPRALGWARARRQVRPDAANSRRQGARHLGHGARHHRGGGRQMPAGPGRDGQEGFCAIPAEWHGLNVLEESCFLSGAVCQPHQQLRDFLL